MTLSEIYDRKKKAYAGMQALNEEHRDDWSDEHQQRWDAFDAEMTQCDADIEAFKAAEARTARLQQMQDVAARETHGDNTTRGEMQANREGRIAGMDDNAMRSLALRAWLNPAGAGENGTRAAQKYGINLQQSRIEVQAFRNFDQADGLQVPDANGGIRSGIRRVIESRQQGVGTDTAGGFLVPEGVMQPLEVALLQFGAPRRYSSITRAGNGRTIPWPTVNDTAVLGERIAENAAANQGDITFGSASTTPELYSSKYVPVSIQLMQDSNESMDALVGRLLGERIGRIQSDEFTTLAGDGAASGPIGLVAVGGAADSGVTLAAANTPTYAELMTIKHSVDPAYRMMGQGWTFADAVLSGIKQIETNNGPLWRPGLADSVPNTIDGDPYFVNQSMPVALSGKSIAYGQLDKYKIHDATDMIFQRLTELHALNHQVTFLAFMRSNGLLLDAGTEPVKFATNPAA